VDAQLPVALARQGRAVLVPSHLMSELQDTAAFSPEARLLLGLLYLFPVIATVIGNLEWYRHLQKVGPRTAGLAVQATGNLDGLAIGPWAGLGVLAAWAAGALLAGGLLLRLRDA
jgi:uncharacterized RDD family membrane protein YckC